VNDGDTIFRNCDDGYLRYDDLELVDTCAFAEEFLVLVYPENTQCDIDQVVQMDRFEVFIQYNCGITDSLEFRVSYVDNKPPFFLSVPADITISCDPDLLPDVAEADDNCTNATVSFTDRTKNEDPQVLERVWYAIDFCGNLDSAIQTITVSGELNCSVIIPDQVPCFKDSVWIFSDIIGGQAPFDHRWEVKGGGCSIIYDGGDSILVETGFGGFVIELVVTDQFGCDTRCEGIGECMLKKGQPGGSFPVRPIFDEIGLSPNPTRGMLNVQIDRDTYNRLTVLNQLGQKMLEISTNTADFSGQIELDHLPAGI
jgi:hypothetical protein